MFKKDDAVVINCTGEKALVDKQEGRIVTVQVIDTNEVVDMLDSDLSRYEFYSGCVV